MKKAILDSRFKSGHARGRRGRTAALLGGLVLALTLPGTGLKAQVPDIARSVLLSWPEPTEEQIVVGSDSPTGPVWTPWPEPIYKRFGQMCMAVPTTASQQYFKTVPGRQLADCFSDHWGPFTNRNSWTPYFPYPGSEWIVTDGVLRLNWLGPNSGFGALCPLGTNVTAELRDFYMSEDVLDWVTSGTNWSTIGFVARAKMNVGYGAGLVLNEGGVSGRITPWMSYGSWQTNGVPFVIGEIAPPYRLEYSATGTQFSFRVVSLTTQQVIQEMSITHSARSQGFAGIFVNAPSGLNESHSITVDNFFLSGTKP